MYFFIDKSSFSVDIVQGVHNRPNHCFETVNVQADLRKLRRLPGPDLGWMPDKYRAAVVATDGVSRQIFSSAALKRPSKRWVLSWKAIYCPPFSANPSVMISWSSILEKVEKDRLTETIHRVCLQGLSCFESRPHKW